MGVRNFKITQQATIIGRACRMWERKGIWSEWMGRRYIKDRPFNVIELRQSNSSTWKTILRQRTHISKCATLGGTGSSIKNVVSTIRPDHPSDNLAKGIWAVKIGKVALNL